MTFKDLKLAPLLLNALEEANYSIPTPIQENAIPVILSQNDLIGCAQTGTGKTASYVLPILQLLLNANSSSTDVQALIIAPTRELVLQISDNIKLYSKYLAIKHVTLIGGESVTKQINRIKAKPQIIVATPGRLLDLVQQKEITLRSVKHLVLDEADQMLDMGFLKDIQRILKVIPENKQTLLFSATMPESIKKFALSIQKNPKEVIISKVSSTAHTVKQSVFMTDMAVKKDLLQQVFVNTNNKKCIVFVKTKYGADKLVKFLGKSGFKAVAIHGNKSQNARVKALSDFKDNTIKILIATDIAARGIDIEQLPLVINYDIPHVAETYVHRIGRTGRAGMSGEAISFCSEEELKDLKSIQKLIGQKLHVNEELMFN